MKKLFTVTNSKYLTWEGFAESITEVRERFPQGEITEWKETGFTNIYEA